MKKMILFTCLIHGFHFLIMHAQNDLPKLAFEQDANTTATYHESIQFYEALSQASNLVDLQTWGQSDAGYPLHTIILSKDGIFSPEEIRQSGRLILFINNAIHPGEPCGVDATQLLFRDIAVKGNLMQELEHLVIVAIPFYNIGGGLNRGSHSRANQNGPVAHGFRGNAQNLDLNRDFIKCDSKNAQTFNQLYNYWKPDVFIDNHTSNGADYQYTLTLIPTQHNKLAPSLATYLKKDLLPQLFETMKTKGWEMTPYVYARSTPDEGIAGFLDLPRYSSGYAALHHAISFMPETHMLKPYKDRVRSTYLFMETMVENMAKDHKKIATARSNAIQAAKEQQNFDLNWKLDATKADTILFKGYEAKYKTSAVSFLDRLYYDRNAPYEKKIPHFNYYTPTLSVDKPIAYIIPQAYSAVIERLQWNGVQLKRLNEDVELEVELYRIDDLETTSYPYEKHYLHSQVEVSKETKNWQFHKGDFVVYANQDANRYIIETLEPQAPDSYFAWNFFDGILMQKEYFSSYVFEDIAAELLRQNPDLRKRLEKKRNTDEKFANSARAQLNFVYQNSPYYEPTHRIYPVGRLLKNINLSLEK